MTSILNPFIKAELILAAALSCLSLCQAQTTPVSVHGQLKVQGNRIVNKNGQPVTLHGMSMYAWASQGLQYYTAAAVKRLIQEWKCTVIRVPILPGKVSVQTGQLKTVVDACIANGVYVIIDWHSMGGAQASAASTFFKSMATAYGNTPNVMYETWNEPVNENWATIKAYHTQVIQAIRAIDPDNIIICGNPQWDQRSDLAAADPITVSSNIAYSLHFYAATHKAQFRTYAKAALDKGIALFSTEYGTSEASGNGAFNAAETQLWWTFLDQNGIGCANWSVAALSETSAAFKTGTSATNWTDGDLNPSGTLVKAYIISKYESTLTTGIDPKGALGYGNGKGLGLSSAEGDADAMVVYAIDGRRVKRVAQEKLSIGNYFLREAGIGKARRLLLSR
jgi:endoglucanase